MPAKSPSRPRNRLLTVLSQADFGLLQPHLGGPPLDVRKSLEVPNLRIDDVYFPNVGNRIGGCDPGKGHAGRGRTGRERGHDWYVCGAGQRPLAK